MKYNNIILFTLIVLSISVGCQSNENSITNEEAKLVLDKVETMHIDVDGKLAYEILDSSYIHYSPLFPSPASGIDAYAYNIKSNLRSFPDFSLKIDSFFVKGDIIYSYWTRKGTNTGSLGRMPTTGKKINFSGFTFYRVKDGKILEEHTYWNVLELYKQLGFQILPPVFEEK
ncbi:MAG: ester cyclase [Ignavibacteria bacterium]|nr:ester cyclase [Ignavibacteria bacterium]MBT8381596.1 ester cyclase [Ignavibacteria bacterium]MBT8391987.1 ester cyclase [Ignavibacteria bacterium]NNJ53153.1 ester cyclase [Ignavibacteriaceae bacterium]NNL21048.1 ester cyclase [Ignavibacteriaceae bacterium]